MITKEGVKGNILELLITFSSSEKLYSCLASLLKSHRGLVKISPDPPKRQVDSKGQDLNASFFDDILTNMCDVYQMLETILGTKEYSDKQVGS